MLRKITVENYGVEDGVIHESHDTPQYETNGNARLVGMRHLVGLLILLFAISASAQVPAATEADFVVKDFHIRSGEMLPEVRIHYATIGKLQKTAQGRNRSMIRPRRADRRRRSWPDAFSIGH